MISKFYLIWSIISGSIFGISVYMFFNNHGPQQPPFIPELVVFGTCIWFSYNVLMSIKNESDLHSCKTVKRQPEK